MGRLRCTQCGRSRPERETTLVSGQIGGNYRRASRPGKRRVCRDCTVDRVEYARRGQAERRHTPVDEGRIRWSMAARYFGIDIEGLT